MSDRVKRHTIQFNKSGASICEHDLGNWVEYEDYLALQAKVARLEAENEGLKEDRKFIDAISNEYWSVK